MPGEFADENAKRDTLIKLLELSDRRRREADEQRQKLEEISQAVKARAQPEHPRQAPAPQPVPKRKRGRALLGLFLITLGIGTGLVAAESSNAILGLVAGGLAAMGFGSLMR